MGVHDVREALKHLPEARSITMTYGNGGATEIWSLGEKSVELPSGASHAEIEDGLTKKKL